MGDAALPAKAKGTRYINAPFNAIATEFPDLIFVDGRYRVACALESANRAFYAEPARNFCSMIMHLENIITPSKNI